MSAPDITTNMELFLWDGGEEGKTEWEAVLEQPPQEAAPGKDKKVDVLEGWGLKRQDDPFKV